MDVTDARRGSASFDKAVFSPQSHDLVTFVPDFRVWDPRTGRRWGAAAPCGS
jgi:hypothetical protein